MKLKTVLSMGVFYILMVSIFISAALLGSEVTSTLAERMPLEREHIIVIDPGHGGEDGGATSISGKLESAYNLEIALGLRDLMHLLGYETKMVRTRDESVYTEGHTLAEKKVSDLKNRVNTGFVSIDNSVVPNAFTLAPILLNTPWKPPPPCEICRIELANPLFMPNALLMLSS